MEHLEIMMIYFHNFGIKINRLANFQLMWLNALYNKIIYIKKTTLFIKYNAYGSLNNIIKYNRKRLFDKRVLCE